MDNGAVSYESSENLIWAYNALKDIFSPYKFGLQQHVSNDSALNEIIASNNESVSTENSLFGLTWNTKEDSLSSPKLVLDEYANTKRKILRSIASNFDLLNFHGPLLNRARLFMHKLQLSQQLGWDDPLPPTDVKEWILIAKQVNKCETFPVQRFVGDRNDTYQLVAFTDSSKFMYGTVVFIYNEKSKTSHFLCGKNRIVNKSLESKSIPSLEMQGIELGVQTLLDVYRELADKSCVIPIRITELKLFSDSQISLFWLQSYAEKIEKMNRLSVFVKNRLNTICKLCEGFPVSFFFCAGKENPADYITRPTSAKQFAASNYLYGISAEMIDNPEQFDFPSVTIPNHGIMETKIISINMGGSSESKILSHLFDVGRCGTFSKIVGVYESILRFIRKLKARVKIGSSCISEVSSLEMSAHKLVIIREQHTFFPEVHNYFDSGSKKIKDLPDVVKRLNVYRDEEGILRVKCKLKRWGVKLDYPILLSKSSEVTEKLIRSVHEKLNHSGLYTTLSEIRKKFWIPQVFSIIKRTLKACIKCRRFNNRTIKLNQSPYRNFRLDPPNIPYRYLFLDYLGPYEILRPDGRKKCYILLFTCLWSRSVHLQLCLDLSTKNFIRAFQLHIFEFGCPELCVSDLGSQIVSGSRLIEGIMKSNATESFMKSNNIKPIKFEQYAKGCSKLGGLVESMVKLTKRLIYGAVGNSILDQADFEFLIKETIHIINRRPVAFQSGLRDSSLNEEIPSAITPEILVKGYELNSLDVIPASENDQTWLPVEDLDSHIKENFRALTKARKKLAEIYEHEFLAGIMRNSTCDPQKYLPVKHNALAPGDIVLLKDINVKPSNYNMAVVDRTIVNEIGEVTAVHAYKGKTREKIFRHVTSLIPLFRPQGDIEFRSDGQANSESIAAEATGRPCRRAAADSRVKTLGMMKQGLV